MSGPAFLVLKPSSMGDIVHGLLVARMIKDKLPGATIHWVTRDIFAPLVRSCPVADKVLVFHRNAGVLSYLRLVQNIRRRRFDYVLDFQGLARTGLLTLLARAEQKIGRSDSREGARYCYQKLVPLPVTGIRSHAVDILAEFLPVLGLPRKITPHLPMRIPQVAAEHAQCTQAVLIFPESSRPEKNWPGYAELTADLCRNMPDTRIIWAGAETISCPQAEGRKNFVNLTAATTLPELMALLTQARLAVGNDSGPLHLAAALGIPTLTLFGPTNPKLYRPYPGDDRQNLVLQAPQGMFSNLSAAVVLEKIKDMLRSSP